LAVGGVFAGVVAAGAGELVAGGGPVSVGGRVVCGDVEPGVDEVGAVVLVAPGVAVVAGDVAAAPLGAAVALVTATGPAAAGVPNSGAIAAKPACGVGAEAVGWVTDWLTAGVCASPGCRACVPT
jgi:hypothetical protein